MAKSGRHSKRDSDSNNSDRPSSSGVVAAGDGEAEIVKEAISKFTAAKGGAPSADEEALVTHKCRWAISLKAFRALRQEISGSIEPKPKPLLVLVNL